MSECVAGIGYLATANPDDKRWVLISIREPAVQSKWLGAPDQDVVAVGITIETAIELRAELNAFLAKHGVSEN